MYGEAMCPVCGEFFVVQGHPEAQAAADWLLSLHVSQCRQVREALEDALERMLTER